MGLRPLDMQSSATLALLDMCRFAARCGRTPYMYRICTGLSISSRQRRGGSRRLLATRPLRVTGKLIDRSCDKFMSICLPSANSIYGLTAIRYAKFRCAHFARYVPLCGTLWTDTINRNDKPITICVVTTGNFLYAHSGQTENQIACSCDRF